MNYNFTHLKNKRLFIAIPTHSVVIQVTKNTIRARKEKWIQFLTLLHLFQKGEHIMNYE